MDDDGGGGSGQSSSCLVELGICKDEIRLYKPKKQNLPSRISRLSGNVIFCGFSSFFFIDQYSYSMR
jgi:hypothetical protein